MMADMYKHTPAPWRYNSVNDFITAYFLKKEPVICRMARIHEYKANAALIAAAPDLLRERDELKAKNAGLVKALYAIREDTKEMDTYLMAHEALQKHEATK